MVMANLKVVLLNPGLLNAFAGSVGHAGMVGSGWQPSGSELLSKGIALVARQAIDNA